jgi:hypothetical protein
VNWIHGLYFFPKRIGFEIAYPLTFGYDEEDVKTNHDYRMMGYEESKSNI